MPKKVEEVALKEMNRLERMNPVSAEYTVSRTYLDYLITIPWNKKTVDNLDLCRAQVIPVPHEMAMTGELTLSGRVLPVGGIKEKILAARRAGVKTVVLPKKNEENLNDIPDYVRGEINLVLVEHIQEVLDLTLL
jgi:ATP-dependent Lon protease